MKKLILTILIMLTATAFGSGNFEITDEGVKVMSPDGTQVIFLSGEGLGTYENLKDNSLAINTTVYTTADKILTTDIPGTGTLSFWTRTTGPATLTTAHAGDKIVTTGTIQGGTLTDGTLSINSGSITDAINGTFSGTVQGGQITSTGNIIIADNGFIGSVSQPEAMQIASTGLATFSDAVLVNGGVLQITSSVPEVSIILIDSDSGGAIVYTGDDDLFTFTGDVLVPQLTAEDNITIGDGSGSVVSLFLSGGEQGLFEIEWEEGMEEGDNDFLAFRAENTAKWDIHLGDMTLIVDGTTGTLTLQDFDVVIEEATKLQGTVTLSGLTGPSGIYINVLEEITTVVPDGIVGHLKRTGTLLETANAGDDLELGGDLSLTKVGGVLSLENAETISNAIDGTIRLAGVGGGINNTMDFKFDTASSVMDLSTSATNFRFLKGIVVGAEKAFGLGNGSEATFRWKTSTGDNDHLQLAMFLGSVNFSGYMTLVETGDRNSANRGVPIAANPTLRIFSADVTEADDWIDFYYDGALDGGVGRAIINVGQGFLGLPATAIGNGTDELQVSATGDLRFGGGGGFVEGHMTIPAVDVVVDTSGTADPVEVADDGTGVPDAGDGWASVYQNEVTFAVSDLHYQTVTIAGTYKVIWDQSPKTAAGGGTVIHGGIMIDGVAVRDNGEGHAHIFNANDNIQINGIGVIDCPNGNEEISLWVSNNANQKTVIEHGNMNIQMIGGT